MLARDAGVEGVIVSNHGGRQVDGGVAALDALVEVREALGADATVLMDGGIRHGADVVKALALGADAVLVGRPVRLRARGRRQGGRRGGAPPALGGDGHHDGARRTLVGARPRRVDPLVATMTTCPSCGRDNPDDARFCNACGARARERRARARESARWSRSSSATSSARRASASRPTPRRSARGCAATSRTSARSSSGTAARWRSSSATR